MDITKRLIGRSATLVPGQHGASGVDLNGLIRRLILFDSYILNSIRLQEFPFLADALGYEGTLALLKSSAFSIECESVSIAQTGQFTYAREQKGILPQLSFCLRGLDAHSHHDYLDRCLRDLEFKELKRTDIRRLKRAMEKKIVRLPPGFPRKLSVESTKGVLGKPHVVKKSVQIAVQQMLNKTPDQFELSVHAIDEEDIRVETDLGKRLGIDLETTHKVVERGVMGVAGLTQRFAEMEAYSALSGFVTEDLPLVEEHLGFLAQIVLPDKKEQQFTRVVGIAGFPDFAPAISERRVDMKRLLAIRESTECREFRDWVSGLDSATDKEIKERLDSLRSTLGNAIQSTEGRIIRFLVTWGLGKIPVVGDVASVLDTFAIEKLLPRSGPVAFINKMYPSIFKAE